MSDQRNAQKETEELRLLYSISIEDIRYARNHQRDITYYCLLIYVAIIGFYKLIQQESDFTCSTQNFFYSLPLIIPALLAGFAGIWHIMDTHTRLIQYRKKLTRIEKTFEALPGDIAKKQPGYLEIGRYFWVFPGMFFFLVALGFCYVAWFICGRYYNMLGVFTCGFIIEVSYIMFVYTRHKKKLKRLLKEKQ